MSEAALEPSFRDDRSLALPLLLAVALHLAVVFGVHFPPAHLSAPRFGAIEVVLAPPPPAPPAAPAEPPLATLDLPPPPPVVAARPPVSAPSPAAAPRPTPRAKPRPAPRVAPPPAAVATSSPAPAVLAAPAGAARGDLPLPTGAQLLERSLAIAATGAGLIEERSMSGEPEAQRTAYVTANTRDFGLVAYKGAWFDKVTNIGNINYPEEARRQGLTGRLQLDVAVNADGSLKGVSIKHSSGFEALDEAAKRIVELAAPFAPFPPDIARRYDVIHMTNWWRFGDAGGFSGQE